jgi:signal transduction histidine kinase/ActR/RegA family two-component response regulator
MHADDIFLVRDIFTRILSGEASAEFEGRIKTSDGNFIVTDFLISPQQRNNKIIGVLGIGRDISERRRAEEKKKILEAQLLQAQKLESLGTLASGIAHDFNNILGIIIGHASSLDGLIPDRATIQKNVAAILKAGIRGAAVVKQMLTFARKTETLIEPVAINEIVTEVAKLLRGTFAKTISVVLAPEPSIPLINADANQIHQVMLNLCVNARDAMPDGGTLTLTTHQEAGAAVRGAPPEAAGTDYVVLSVTDTGIGMDEETQQRVFEPFFTTKERDKGTGLGLSLVFGIMESHGGFVTLQSVPGEGSTFNCCFPVLHDVSDQASRTTAKTEGVPGGGETILVVEDEGTLRELIRAFLSAKGYTVLTANNGEEAFSIFTQRQNEIHLVLSDLGLPKFGGDELFRKITKTNPRIPTILASGYIEPGMKVRMLEEGVREFIQKPYNPNEVLVAIRRVLDGEPPSARPGKNHV